MIHIQEKSMATHDMLIKVGGVLDAEAIPVLKNVCDINLAKGKKVTLDFDSVLHITREGRKFVREIGSKVIIQSMPEFMILGQETQQRDAGHR